MAIAAVEFVTLEDCSSGQCLPPNNHQDLCTNQTAKDGFCDNLADGAALCAQAHDPQYWDFIACLFRGNGWSRDGTKSGLALDAEFEPTVRQCASNTLATYAFKDLKACYTGAEGSAMRIDAAAKAVAKGAVHPVWIYVDDQLVREQGPPNPTADLTSWAADVTSAMCAAYTGKLPTACSKTIQV